MEELESYAFSGCDNLVRAVLPANSNMLGELIFTGCGNLREVVCMSETPPTFDCDSPLFDPLETEIWQQCRLIIPSSSEPLYSKAPGWNLFYN